MFDTAQCLPVPRLHVGWKELAENTLNECLSVEEQFDVLKDRYSSLCLLGVLSASFQEARYAVQKGSRLVNFRTKPTGSLLTVLFAEIPITVPGN